MDFGDAAKEYYPPEVIADKAQELFIKLNEQYVWTHGTLVMMANIAYSVRCFIKEHMPLWPVDGWEITCDLDTSTRAARVSFERRVGRRIL